MTTYSLLIERLNGMEHPVVCCDYIERRTSETGRVSEHVYVCNNKGYDTHVLDVQWPSCLRSKIVPITKIPCF